VLHQITQLFTMRQLRLPLLGLLLTLGVVGEQTQPVLSQQTPSTSAAIPLNTNFEGSSEESPVLSRLRQVREQRNLRRRLAIEREQRQNLAQQAPTVTPVNGEVKQRSRLVSSNQLLRNINTPAPMTAPFPRSRPAPRTGFPAEDGTYLYGQSPTPDQIGQGYIVFEQHQGRITGALYMPQSEFSCFQGALQPSGELAMTVNSSPGEVGVNQIATGNQFQIPNFNDDQTHSYAYTVTLHDYHRIDAISANDRRIVQMCQEFYTNLN
jgi:hypothetical protein